MKRLFKRPFLSFCAGSFVLVLSLGTLLSAGFSEIRAESEVTTGSLVNEMIDLGRLAEFPNPSYSVLQVSSYDRRSKAFGGENWFANSDGFGKEPLPGVAAVLREPVKDQAGLYLLADVKGPGAIVRTWTARMNGEITVWLDDSERPNIQGIGQRFPARDSIRPLQCTGRP